MFVFSFKFPKKGFISCTIGVVAFAFITLLAINNYNNIHAESVMKKYETKVRNNNDRVTFLSQLGWTVNSEPLEIEEIEIPNTFNSTYDEYNQLQISQGFNLKKYKGKTCRLFSYRIPNYPDTRVDVRANLIVYNNKLIGGDISSDKFKGFMHSLMKNQKTDVSISNYAFDTTHEKQVYNSVKQ